MIRPLPSSVSALPASPAIAMLLLLSACTSAPQQETSEQKLEAQAKAIEQAADKMVDAAIADFDVTEIPQDADNQAN